MDIKKILKTMVNPMPAEGLVGGEPRGEPLALKDVIAPPAIDVDFDFLKIGNVYYRTLFVAGYPRFVSANWLEPLISFNHTLEIAMYVYPTRSEEVLENLKRKVGEMEATIQSDMKRGRVIEPSVQVALEDALALQQELAKGAQRFFQFGLYITIPAKTIEDLNKATKSVEATLASLLIVTKRATLQMEEGLKTTLPMGQDKLVITRNMDTTSLATTFPFTTSELTANEGILYGINSHNDSLVIFDRFTLENANTVVFGKSIARWEPVLIRENGQMKLETIGNLVESLIAKRGITHRDEKMEGVKLPGIDVYAYDNDLRGRWSPVSVAARKPFSRREKLYTITTKSGRKITVTADHSLIVLRSGRVQSMRGEAVRVGEAIPVPRSLPEPKEHLLTVYPNTLVPSWPASLPQTIPLESDLLTLLGLTTSEGYLSPSMLNIYNRDPMVLTAIRTAASAIGAKSAPRYAAKRILCGYNIQPNAYAKLFTALGAGGRSGQKRVPPIIFSLSNARVAAYLRAYYEGDGTVSAQEASCCSKSESLVSDIAYLLLRFGIVGRIRPKWRRAANTNDTGDTYYELVISGADHLTKFAKHIGFLLPQKQQKLLKLLGRRGNTNVDTIPTLSKILQKLHAQLYQGDGVRAPYNLSPLKRGIFAPSREQLLEIITLMENRIASLRALRSRVVHLKHLPSVDAIIARSIKHRQLHRALWNELGQTWRLMKHRAVVPRATTVFRAWKTVSGETIALPEVKQELYDVFRETGISLLGHNKSLWDSIVNEVRRPGDTAYPPIQKAVSTLSKRYRSLQLTLRHAQKTLDDLRRLAGSDLFWDPIVKIERIKHNESYVYDLTVDNEVFLGGSGGLFVHNSGSGKSYLVKLEILRSLMFDTDVIVIDPENEYEALARALGGEYIRFHFGTTTKINPFDIALLHQAKGKEEESELNQKILSLHGFFRVVMGKLSASEDALLDRALILAYKQKGITPDPTTQGKEPPLMEDLYKTLVGMEDPVARGLADRIEKFVKGSLVGIFDQQTNVEIRNQLTVFSIRDLEDELRPIAMYLILDFIWTKIRRDVKRRILIVDEAWYMMKYPDSGAFLNSIAKRARKYYLGLTTITQDVEDFLSVDLGKTIIQNSSLQILLKQSTAAIDRVAEIFFLSEGEKHLLLSSNIGEGLFFAGPAHAAIRIISSPTEHALITTKPQDLEAQKAAADAAEAAAKPSQVPSTKPPLPPNRPIFTVEQLSNNKSV